MLFNKLKSKNLAGLVTFSLMLIGSSLVTSKSFANQLVQTGNKSQISVIVDEAKLLRLDDSASQIIIGNPGIADITVQSTKLLVLTGKSYGLTNIIILNKHGETILNTRISVDDDHTRSVSLHKGSKRASFHCTGDSVCNASANMGDDSGHLGQTAGRIQTRKSITLSTSKQVDLSSISRKSASNGGGMRR